MAGPFVSPELRSSGGEVVVAVDVRSGRITRALLLAWEGAGDAGRKRNCCPVEGWFDSDTVVVRSADRLLGWNLRTGSLHLVTELPYGTGAAAFSALAWHR